MVDSPITLVLLMVAIVAMLVSVYDRYRIEREMANRWEQREVEQKSLEERKQELERRVDYLKDERGVEAEIRKNLDVVREGEQVVVIVDNERPGRADPDNLAGEVETEAGWWSRLLSWSSAWR